MNFSGLTEEEILEQQKFADELHRKHQISLELYLNTLINQKGCCGVCSKNESDFEGSFDVFKPKPTDKTMILACPTCSSVLNWSKENPIHFNKVCQIISPEVKKEKMSKLSKKVTKPLGTQFSSDFGF